MTKHVSVIGFYLNRNPKERISYLYEHYSEYPHISASYQDMLQRRIAVIRSYERQRRDELGVRVMSGNPVSSITENMACENSEIADIVVSGYLPSGVIHDLEDQREIRLGLHEMQIMQREYEAFNAALMGNLDGEELGIFMSHIRREKTMEKMAKEFGVERDSVKKRIYRIKVKLVNILLEEFKEIA